MSKANEETSQVERLVICGLPAKIIIDNFKLPVDVTIGSATFRKGVPLKLVIERLQRQFEYNKST